MQAGRVRSLVEVPLAAAGLVVEDVAVSAAGRRSVVRIAVDRGLAGLAHNDVGSVVAPLSLDEVADATRIVDTALDADPSLGDAPYVLEVSSPGVGRPLTQQRQFRRNVGRLVRLRLVEGTTVAGRILSVSETTIVVVNSPAEGATGPAAGAAQVAGDTTAIEIPLAQVRDGRIEVEFARPDDSDLDDADFDDADLDLDVDDLDESDEHDETVEEG